MILGVSGPYASGKGEVVAFLKERSFLGYSLSDVIRRELADRGLEETRERMIETGNSIRAAEGPGALAVRLLPKLLGDRNYVIDSIRHPAEVGALREADERFRLIWVDADEAVRFKRMRERGRAGDPESISAFRDLEGRELESEDPLGQRLLEVRALADETLDNNGGKRRTAGRG
jgi:dephospho-CoA kinase